MLIKDSHDIGVESIKAPDFSYGVLLLSHKYIIMSLRRIYLTLSSILYLFL